MRFRINERRTELGMTMKELADAVGVSEATISRWESGKTPNMRRDHMDALCKALKATPSYLLGWDEQTSLTPGYFGDPEVARIAQEAYENPELRILFDCARDISKEDMLYVIDLVKRLKGDK